MAGEVCKENLLLLSNVIAMRQLVVPNRHWVCLQNVIVHFSRRQTMLRQTLIFIALLTTLTNFKTFSQSDKYRLTIIKNGNRFLDRQFKTDTLFKDTVVDLSKKPVDLYFTHRLMHFPYYMPTGGLKKTNFQSGECNFKFYPRTVKCYQYDSLDRVTRMQVEGSGTKGYWYFKYDTCNKCDRIVQLIRDTRTYTMTYNEYGNLKQIDQVDGDMLEHIYFVYRKVD